MIDTTGLDPDQVNVLEYMLEMLQHGMQPRIINVTPETVAERLAARMEGDDPAAVFMALTGDREAQWKLAKQADEEVENDPFWLNGVDEQLHDATDTVLDEMEDSE